MKLHAPLWLVVALPLIVGGCLLPQPDTPPIPPSRQSAPIGPGYGAGTLPSSAQTTVAPQASATADQAATADATATPDAAATTTTGPSPSPTPTASPR